jgi:hypothetical protein
MKTGKDNRRDAEGAEENRKRTKKKNGNRKGRLGALGFSAVKPS